jgi:DNA-binding CsgD family transcriptional regulator
MASSPDSSFHSLALSADSVPQWRKWALAKLAEDLRFDVAIFHEFSPRVPLEQGAFFGIEPRVLEQTKHLWDENAVALARLTQTALSQGGAATDGEAFEGDRRGKSEWRRRVQEGLGIYSALAGHLVVRDRIRALILLGRKAPPIFSPIERKVLCSLIPSLTVADAFQTSLSGASNVGATTQVKCVDQRLTKRQREVVEQVALGASNEDAGLALGISAHTVRNLLVEVRRKLDAGNRAEIVRLAVLR